MPEPDKTYRIFISAAEPSADAHCAGLIKALKQSGKTIDFVGVGGAKMAAEGCQLLETTTDKAAMAYKAFSKIAGFYKLIKRITAFLKSNKVDLVIVCDSPAFNFHIAKAAKKAGIKTLFYVAPQLWAWASWRLGKLRKCCDKLCCILPFERDWFSQRGIDVVYVGNPLMDELDTDFVNCRREYSDFKPENAQIAIMPGSREAEIDSLWQPMQKIAIQLKQKYPGISFTTVAVDAESQKILKQAQIAGFQCNYATGMVNQAARRADLSIVASGSATLQIAAAGCPMVIMYQSSRIIWYLIGWWLIKTKYLSLVNILAAKQLVPEFMPYFNSTGPVVKSIEQLLNSRENLAKISNELIEIAEPLGRASAAQKTAQTAIQMLS